MPRRSYDDMVSVVSDQIRSAGGEIEHDDLVSRLASAGQYDTIQALPQIAQRRDVLAVTRATGADTLAAVFYSLPPSAAPAAPAPARASGGDA